MASNNSVPLGQAGTGAAFILPESQAAKRLVQTMDYNAQIAAQERSLKNQQAQQLAADWQKNKLKVDGGIYWQPEFDQRADKLLKKGIQLRQMGINPYRIDPSNPLQAKVAEDFLLEKQGIESDIDTRKAKEVALAKQFADLKSDPTSFRTQSVKELNDYISQPFSATKNQPIPTLEKAFNPETELYSKVKAVTTPTKTEVIYGKTPFEDFKVTGKTIDKDATLKEAASTLLGTPKGIQYVEDQTGKTLSQLNKIPDSWDENMKLAIERYNGDPKMREDFAKYGATTLDQVMPLLQPMVVADYQAKQKYNEILNTAVQRASAGVNLIDSKVPDRTRFNDAEKLKADALARERENRLREGDSGTVKLTDRSLPLGQNNPNGQQAVVYGKNGVSFTTPVMNMVGAKIIDANTGSEFASADSSSDIAIAGLIQAPILNKDVTLTRNGKKTTLKAGSVVQKSYADNNPDNVYYKKVGVAQKPRTGGKFSTVYVDASSIPQNGLSKKAQGIYDAFMSEPDYVAPQKATNKPTANKKTIAGF